MGKERKRKGSDHAICLLLIHYHDYYRAEVCLEDTF